MLNLMNVFRNALKRLFFSQKYVFLCKLVMYCYDCVSYLWDNLFLILHSILTLFPFRTAFDCIFHLLPGSVFPFVDSKSIVYYFSKSFCKFTSVLKGKTDIQISQYIPQGLLLHFHVSCMYLVYFSQLQFEMCHPFHWLNFIPSCQCLIFIFPKCIA